MRMAAAVLLFVVALLVVPVAPSHAWSGHGGGGHSGWHGGGGQSGWHGGAWGGQTGWHGGAWGWQSGWHGGWGWNGGWHGSVIIGTPWVGPLYPYPYAYPYPYYPPYYPYPPAVVQAPPVYVEQSPAAASAPAQTSWYYCASSKAYYPDVPKCREAWIKVPPTPQ